MFLAVPRAVAHGSWCSKKQHFFISKKYIENLVKYVKYPVHSVEEHKTDGKNNAGVGVDDVDVSNLRHR